MFLSSNYLYLFYAIGCLGKMTAPSYMHIEAYPLVMAWSFIREALNFGAQGASEFQDVMGAGLYLRNRTEVDPNKIGLWGGSYGGYLTAMGLAKASNLFAAGVDIHGVHDWNVVIKNFVPSYNSEERLEFARLALASSPMPYVKDWTSPVLLIHGDD
ncbi:MAG: prolyl oligopeptidase family serine peptidase, partial [Cyclobacteriaceae bacterium]|nr:prolyl oligopeptidase family serine peptidase [Cyclobacteriaceae bacterium]